VFLWTDRFCCALFNSPHARQRRRGDYRGILATLRVNSPPVVCEICFDSNADA
jgi:hypothetical protein